MKDKMEDSNLDKILFFLSLVLGLSEVCDCAPVKNAAQEFSFNDIEWTLRHEHKHPVENVDLVDNFRDNSTDIEKLPIFIFDDTAGNLKSKTHDQPGSAKRNPLLDLKSLFSKSDAQYLSSDVQSDVKSELNKTGSQKSTNASNPATSPALDVEKRNDKNQNKGDKSSQETLLRHDSVPKRDPLLSNQNPDLSTTSTTQISSQTDEYVDRLHEALISVGAPDEDFQPEGQGQKHASASTVIVSSTTGDRKTSDNPNTKVISLEKEFPFAPSVVATREKTTRADLVATSTPEIKMDRGDSGVPRNQSQHDLQSGHHGNHVIQLPNGIVIDALFDSIDSLQDQLDICEEELRQRLVIHKDIFFGTSRKLTETDEVVELETPDQEDATGVAVVDKDVARVTASRKPPATTERWAPISMKSAPRHSEIGGSNDLERSKYGHGELKERMGFQGDEATSPDSTKPVMINPQTLLDNLTKTGKAGVREGRGDQSSHGATETQAYSFAVRQVIQRLTGRLKYLEQSIKDCQLLTLSIT